MGKTERVRRWDDIRRGQFSSLSSLVLTLATALVAFQAGFLSDGTVDPQLARATGVSSFILLSASMYCGLRCEWTRLLDFRQSAQNARTMGDAMAGKIDAEKLGDKSWELLEWQIAFFYAGSLFAGVRIVFWDRSPLLAVKEQRSLDHLQDARDRPILSVVTDEGLPFQLLAAQAVDAVIAISHEPSLTALVGDGDLRSSIVTAVELLLLDLAKQVTPPERTAIASMMLRHFSATGLLSPRDVMRFAIRNSEKLAGVLREQPHLIADETDISQLLSP